MRKASKDIKGFYEWDFTDIVAELPDRGKLIEIGSYVGKSAVAWAEAFEKAGKDYTIHCVEVFVGIGNTGRASVMNEELKTFLDSLMCTAEEQEQQFIENTKGWNITYEKSHFTEDFKLAEMYEEHTVLWYDANHSEQSVTTAINYWQDKVQTMIIDCYDTVHPETMTAIDTSGLNFKLFEFNKGTKGIALFG